MPPLWHMNSRPEVDTVYHRNSISEFVTDGCMSTVIVHGSLAAIGVVGEYWPVANSSGFASTTPSSRHDEGAAGDSGIAASGSKTLSVFSL